MRSSTPKVQDDKAPSSSLRCRFAIQKPPLLRSKCWQGQSPVERHTNANSKFLEIARGMGRVKHGKVKTHFFEKRHLAGPNCNTLKSMPFCRTCCFFCWSWPSTLVRSAARLLWVTYPINRASQHWSHPPNSVWQKIGNILAFPDFSCSSAVWVMLWTTLASRTCQRIHKKRLKQIPSVLLYYPLPSNIAVATKVEHVDTPYHCFLMPQERLKISGVTKPTVPAVKIPILSYTSKSNITAQKSKNED